MIESTVDFFKEHTFNVVIILVLVSAARRFSVLFLRRVIRNTLKAHKYKTARDEKQREDTLISIFSQAVKIIIWVIGGLLLLSELGIDISPIIASAGIAGVALGFGAQSMVKDFISGMFILAENQYRVDDIIQVNGGVTGAVEQVGLRTTILRDIDGQVHHIPNGYIDYATNMTMEFAKVNLDIGIGYETDIDKLEKVVNKVGADLAQDEEWKDTIIEAPAFKRVEEFGDSSIVVKIVGKTQPMQQWSVTGELRRRLKNAFDKENIEIPFPQRVVHQAKPSPKKK